MPTITTNKDVYVVGETIYWSASGLTPGRKYLVGAMLDDKIFYVPDRDVFIASSSEASGSYYVGSNIVGARTFVLAEFRDSSLVLVASKPITVTTTPPTPTVPTWAWIAGAAVAVAVIATAIMIARKRY